MLMWVCGMTSVRQYYHSIFEQEKKHGALRSLDTTSCLNLGQMIALSNFQFPLVKIRTIPTAEDSCDDWSTNIKYLTLWLQVESQMLYCLSSSPSSPVWQLVIKYCILQKPTREARILQSWSIKFNLFPPHNIGSSRQYKHLLKRNCCGLKK